MTDQQELVYNFLVNRPAQFGQMVGFANLRDDLHGAWIHNMLIGKEDITLQAHRGSYKTTCVCIALAVNLMLRGDINSLFIRKTDTDVQEVIKQVTRIIQHPVTQNVYLALTGKALGIVKATSYEITTSAYTSPRGASQLLGIGIGGSITGKHADRIFTDDIVNVKDRMSQAERERTKAFYQELHNICNPGGRIINTGTPWHKEDAFSLMPPAERFDCYHTGLLSKEKIEELRKSMSPSLFAANYELQHIAVENALFETAPEFFQDEELLRDGIAHIDAAYGGEDYTAFTCGKRIGDKLYLYGRMWRKHVDTVLDAILSESERLKCAPIYCETNADKGFLMKEIKRQKPEMPVRIYHEKENKYQKISEYLRKWWRNIYWLEGTDKEYLAQIMDFTEEAEHDDAPDSAACVARYFDRRNGEEYKSPFSQRGARYD